MSIGLMLLFVGAAFVLGFLIGATIADPGL
jgi:hypothetical protein